LFFAHLSSAHEDAARWVSGFRRLDLFVSQRKLHVWFVAAPPQYCFQQYKLTMTNTQFEETTVFVSNVSQLLQKYCHGTQIVFSTSSSPNDLIM
jgi:hypothetical protein